MTEKLQLTKSDRKKVWWRSTFLQGSWNFERMQNLGWAYTLIPAIKKLYTKKEDQIAALERHLEFFNTHPYVAAPVMGVTLALEEERANGVEIDDAAIQGVKIGMMGPLLVSVTQYSGLQYAQSLDLSVLHLPLLAISWGHSSSLLHGT
ncbi:PTS system mannose/fructose/sorbose family transporter subunit IID [Streptococcus pneumoniae]|nr:PTS system mannose/fructose/sorbose family transporter subunit IID [Streptococcus pneumoniae]